MKKLTVWILTLAMGLSLCACGGPSPEEIAAENYQQAMTLLEEGNYAEALPILRELGDYQDAPSLRKSAAFALTREYVKDNGTFHQAGEGLETGSFPYAVREDLSGGASEGVAEEYYRFIALDENDNVVFGMSQNLHNIAGIMIWSFWMTLSETSNMAENVWMAADYLTMGDRSMTQADYGTEDFDITTYDENSDLDMTYERTTTNYLGEVTTESKTISWAKQPFLLEEIYDIPIDLQPMLETIGVTLGDLGFAAMDQASAEEEGEAVQEETAPEEVTEPEEAADSEEASQGASGGVQGDAIAMTTEDGMADMKYVGWEYIPAGVLADDTVDESKVIVILMDYTNRREEEPKQMQGDFYYKVFQNGVELSDPSGGYYSGVYDPLENFFKEVMMGGTVTTGQYFLVEDESPIVIMAYERSNQDNKQSMTVELQ